MKNPLKETLEQLNNNPEVIKAGAIGMERQLTIDFMEAVKKVIQTGNFEYDHVELCDWIIEGIRNELHWKKFL